MLTAGTPRLQRAFNCHQDSVEAMQRDRRQNLCHDSVAAGVFEQMPLQQLQGRWHRQEWGAVAQSSWFLDNQGNVVLPVVEGLVTVGRTALFQRLSRLLNRFH